MATIKKIIGKRSISYKATIRRKGYRTLCETFQNEEEAKTWVNEIEDAMRAGTYEEIDTKEYTLGELIDRYIREELPNKSFTNQAKYKMQLYWWKKHLGKRFAKSITPKLLYEHKQILITEKSIKPQKGRTTRTPATANRYMTCLSAVLTIASGEWGCLNENPMRKVKKFQEKPTNERILTEEEIQTLLDACKNFELQGEKYQHETYLFVLIALSTGARYSEILGLKWENIDFKNRQFYFLNTKNKTHRGVPINEKPYKELLKFKKVRNIRSSYLFTTKDGNKLIDMRTRFYKVLKKSKIENLRFHDLRHTVASYIAMSGGSLLDIAQVTGHKTMQMVKRYAHLTPTHTSHLMQQVSNNMSL